MTTLNIRNVPESVARGIKAQAALRGEGIAGWLAYAYAVLRDLEARRGTGMLLIDTQTLRDIVGEDAIIPGTEYTELDALLEQR